MAAVTHGAVLAGLAVTSACGLSLPAGCTQPSTAVPGWPASLASSHGSAIGSNGQQLRCAAKAAGAAGTHDAARRPLRAVCAAAAAAGEDVVPPPTVSDTKAAFLQKYKRPIPNLYNSVIQELLVQQHLIRYNSTYAYDPVFALGFVTVYDQLMDGFPNPADRDVIFRAYIEALTEDPEAYRRDASALEEWAATMDGDSLVGFAAREGTVEALLKDIAARASGEAKGGFHYSRFFAVGLFRLMELAKASDPSTLQKLCEALKVNKMSVDRDLDVYRGLLNKLTQAKDLLREFLAREKLKQAEREREKAQVKAE